MGSLISRQSEEEDLERRIWPVRYFNQIEPGTDLDSVRFSMWDPRKYRDLFKYPKKEPAKDY